jgi:hypothetical protein
METSSSSAQDVCWFCKKGRHSECMKEMPFDAKTEGPDDCTFNTKMVPCKCTHTDKK